MRLSATNLAVFKSFVDLTVLLLASNLAGIVGQNGLGTSASNRCLIENRLGQPTTFHQRLP